jgi:hypothetical protein
MPSGELLLVKGYHPERDVELHVEIDYDVPMRIMTAPTSRPAVRYITIRDSDSGLLEVKVPSDSMQLFSLSLVIFSKKSPSLLVGDEGHRDIGLPIFQLPRNVEFRTATEGHSTYASLKCNIAGCLLANTFEIQLDQHKDFDYCIEAKDVYFLVKGHQLVGIRIVDLGESETATLKNVMARV